MGFRLEMGKEVITKRLAGSWCRARLWRYVENHLSPFPPPWVVLPWGFQQQDWFAPGAPNGMGWPSGLLACPQLLAGLLLLEETHLS